MGNPDILGLYFSYQVAESICVDNSASVALKPEHTRLALITQLKCVTFYAYNKIEIFI
jgi:hypothetical protein